MEMILDLFNGNFMFILLFFLVLSLSWYFFPIKKKESKNNQKEEEKNDSKLNDNDLITYRNYGEKNKLDNFAKATKELLKNNQNK